MKSVHVQRLNHLLKPSQEHVLIRPFIPGDENRCHRTISRVMALTEEQVCAGLDRVIADFTGRHQDIKSVLIRHFEMVRQWMTTDASLSQERQLLVGAYFTQEYSLESAALFNPSMVLHPDQSGLPEGCVRFIMSLRAVGEGHISSIVFRQGIITKNFQVEPLPPASFVTEPLRKPDQTFDKKLFKRQLAELSCENQQSCQNDFSNGVLAALPERFTLAELMHELKQYRRHFPASEQARITADRIDALAHSNYEVTFDAEQRISERVIFPSSPSQHKGIEDARFVLFEDDDGSSVLLWDLHCI